MSEIKTNNVESNKSTYENLEILRTNFLKEYNKQQKISIVILVVFIVLMLASFIILISMPDKIHYVLIAALVIFLGTFLITKKIKNERIKSVTTYVENYRQLINEDIYKNINLQNMEINPLEKIEESTLENINIFDNFEDLHSNDVVKGKFQNHDFLSYSAALYNTKNEIIFYGKIFTLNLDETDGSLIIHQKNEKGKGIIKPINYQEINNVFSDKFICYASSEEIVDKLLDDKAIKNIENLIQDEVFSDYTFVIQDSKIYAFVSCRNDVIDIPLKDPVKEEIFEKQKNLTEIIFKIFKEIK